MVGAPEIVGGTKKKSYSRSASDRSGPGRRKRPQKPSETAVAVVAAGTTAIRIENGEIRPLRKGTLFRVARKIFEPEKIPYFHKNLKVLKIEYF